MSEETPNRQRLRLATADYEKLRWKILERDGWKCQHCGRRDQLQIHHMIRRSQSGADCEGNLVVLVQQLSPLAPLARHVIHGARKTLRTRRLYGRPADRSPQAYKDFIRGMTLALNPDAKDDMTEAQWQQAWKEFWAAASDWPGNHQE